MIIVKDNRSGEELARFRGKNEDDFLNAIDHISGTYVYIEDKADGKGNWIISVE